MAKRGALITVYVLVTLLLIPYSFAQDDRPGGGGTTYDINAPESYTEPDFYSSADFTDSNFRVDLAEKNFDKIPAEKRDDFFQRKYNNPNLNVNVPKSASFENGVLTVGSSTVDMDSFEFGSHTFETQGDKLIINGNAVKGASNVHLENDVVAIDRVDYFSSDAVTISNGVNVRVLDGSVEVERADFVRFNQDNFASTVSQFSGGLEHFFVERADLVNSDCLHFYDIVEAEFWLSDSQAEMQVSDKNVSFDDCGDKFEFVGGPDGSLIVVQETPRTYQLGNGSLFFNQSNYSEWVQAPTGALVIMDEYSGFSCMTIMPGGAYFYSSKSDKRIDFSVESPLYGIDYRLCVRKDSLQTFTSFDGIIDLVNNMNQLDSTVNYRRYPLRNNVLAGVVLEPVYQGLLNPKMKMQLDAHNVYGSNMTVMPHQADKTVAKTIASNYIEIREGPGSKDTQSRTWTKINHTLQEDELTDNLIMNYGDMSITDNVLVHENTIIFPPGHQAISVILG